MRRHATRLAILMVSWLSMSGAAHAAEVYVVRAGDTLWQVSHRFGVRPADLAAANHLALTDMIHPGLRLTLPRGARDAGAPARASMLGRFIPERPWRLALPPDTAAVSPPAQPAAVSSRVIRIAMEFLGRPYQWSGVGFRGFDCSGFIARIFAAVGIALPHSSFAQYAAGVGVSRQALAPGDLVFFHTYGRGASHVGLYIGGSRFIHASRSHGVSIATFDEPYYRDHFIGARRL